MKTSVLIDAAFFLKRYRRLRGTQTPELVADDLHRYACEHLKDKSGKRIADLYRIFVYDCPPLAKKLHNPISKKAIDLSRTPEHDFRVGFQEALRRKRKVALRMGKLTDLEGWGLGASVLSDLLKGRRLPASITEKDVCYQIRQKGVDMKIGLDIAAMAFKRQVDQIVLFTGDSDFVPAAKLLSRRHPHRATRDSKSVHKSISASRKCLFPKKTHF